MSQIPTDTPFGHDPDGEHVTYRFEGQAAGITLEVVTEQQLPTIDPLTSPYFDIWRVLYAKGEHDFGCTCNRPEAAKHDETCMVTPDFAYFVRTIGRTADISRPIINEVLNIREPIGDDAIGDDELDGEPWDFEDDPVELCPGDCPGCTCHLGHPPCGHCLEHIDG